MEQFCETDAIVQKAVYQSKLILGDKHKDNWIAISALAGYMLRKKYGVGSKYYQHISKIKGYVKEIEALFESFDKDIATPFNSFSLVD